MKIDNSIAMQVFESLSERSEIGFFIYNLSDQKFSYISKSLFEITGLEEDSAQPVKDFKDLLNEEDLRYLEELWKKMITGELKEKSYIQVKILKLPEVSKTLEARLSSVLEGGKLAKVVGFIEDITFRKIQEEMLNRYNTKKNSTIEILAHDIQGPLGIIKNTASLIEEKAVSIDLSVNKLAKYIQNVSNNTLELVNNLNSIEYLDSVKIDVKISRVNVVEKVEDSLSIYKLSTEIIKRKFKLEYSSPAIYAEIDESKFIAIALNNLISNSIKFTVDNGIILISIVELEDEIEFCVQDNGIGIPDEIAPFIFDRFTEAKRTGLRGERSIGLGLSIVKKVVDMHNGKIWFSSKVNKGTSFFIRIPKINL